MSLQGIMLEGTPAQLSGQFHPLGGFRDFHFCLKTSGAELRHLNDLAQLYGNFDFQGGSGDFLMQLESINGQLQGYAKPLLNNVDN